MGAQLQRQVRAAQQLSFAPTQAGILQRKCACGKHTIAGGECEECRQKGPLQRAEANAASVSSIPPIVHEVLSSPGHALNAGARAFMEPRFGQDFSRVKVHTDTQAAASARAVNALAYTVGCDVVFDTGQYMPGSSEGRRLLAHELTHVVQQNGDTALMRTGVIGHEESLYEKEAERVSTIVSSTAHEVTTQPFEPPIVQRAPPGLLKQPKAPPKPAEEPIGKIKSRGLEEPIYPSKVKQGIWWFNGATPSVAVLYTNERPLDLGLPSSGRFQYRITKGNDKLALVDGKRQTSSLDVMDQPMPVARGIGASKAAKDVRLSIIHTPPGSKSSDEFTIDLEVRAPHHLELIGCSHAPKGARGYETTFHMRVWDNFGVAMPYIDANEDFDTGTPESGTTTEWSEAIKKRKKGGTTTLGDAVFEDHYAADISGTPPASMTPQPSNPQKPLGGALAATFTHDWFVGSQSTGQGVHVSRHTGKFYADHGQYSHFISPVSPPGKATSCPPEEPPKTAPKKGKNKEPMIGDKL